MTTSTQPTERSWQEIADLKAQWLADPCWDIEETEGFEDHRKGLLGFRLFHEGVWKQAREKRLRERAANLGFSVKAVEMIEALEARIAQLERIIERIDRREWGNG